MDVTKTNLMTNADLAISVVDNLSINLINAFEELLISDNTEIISVNSRYFTTVKNKLFMKYIGIEFEILTKGNFRDDTYGLSL